MRTAVINNWNLDRGIQRQDATSLAFKAVTTGNYGAIDLWLERAAGKLAFKTAPVSGEAAIAELGVEPRVFAAGGLERAVKLQRLPEVMTESRMALRRRIKLRPTGDTRLYIRVQQEDGHRMWSSPIYLFQLIRPQPVVDQATAMTQHNFDAIGAWRWVSPPLAGVDPTYVSARGMAAQARSRACRAPTAGRPARP